MGIKQVTHAPGSPEAKKLGCKCPVLDNGHGRGSGRVDEVDRLYRVECAAKKCVKALSETEE